MSELQRLRQNYQPKLPKALVHFENLKGKVTEPIPVWPEAKTHFPSLQGQSVIQFQESASNSHSLLKVGVVLSGGQAPGGHNVITGLYDALKKLNKKNILYGFIGGPKGIIDYTYVLLDDQKLSAYRNQGGFDLIGSGRTKIEKSEQFAAAQKSAESLQLDGLVIIGGDDSNTNAALLAEYFLQNACKTCVVGVPKTIDGDLKNAYIEASFGFDTASKVYSELIGNIARDALSAKKYYYFIKLMGRSASHITLECAFATHPNYTFISEEVAAKQLNLEELVKDVVDVICRRAEQGKDYGVILIPEGVIEFIPQVNQLIQELNSLLGNNINQEECLKQLTKDSLTCFELLPKKIQEQLFFERDPHGNVQVSKIETEQLFIELIANHLQERKNRGEYTGKFTPQPQFCGYEGRSAMPSNFDSNYCYALGHVAALLINEGFTGYMAALQNLNRGVVDWEILGVPLIAMMTSEIRHGQAKPVIKKGLVELDGLPFKTFIAKRAEWMLADDYQYPGPIQFFGPEKLTESITYTLQLEKSSN